MNFTTSNTLNLTYFQTKTTSPKFVLILSEISPIPVRSFSVRKFYCPNFNSLIFFVLNVKSIEVSKTNMPKQIISKSSPFCSRSIVSPFDEEVLIFLVNRLLFLRSNSNLFTGTNSRQICPSSSPVASHRLQGKM